LALRKIIDGGLYRHPVAHIDDIGVAAPVRNGGSSGIDQIGIDIKQRDLGALGGESVGHGLTQSATRTGDYGRLSGELHNSSSGAFGALSFDPAGRIG